MIRWYLLRAVIILLGGALGYLLGYEPSAPPFLMASYAAIGVIVALIGVIIERILRFASPLGVIGGLGGGVIGLLVARFLAGSLESAFPWEPRVASFAIGLLSLFLGYLGIVIGAQKFREFWLSSLSAVKGGPQAMESPKLLDTSVIIDGRIADICESGFLEGPLIIPQFVLRELQYIADSPDSMKRTRGRRGLDILRRIQKQTNIEVRVVEQDFPKIRGVDSKLVALAKQINGKVITNDYNLNKVAEVQGVVVLNINELSNALKPVVIPGENLKVKIIKEGTEVGQGIAYLEDGTMVVVEAGRKHLGKTLEVVVTSVLQTTAGRMIFTKPKEEAGIPVSD